MNYKIKTKNEIFLSAVVVAHNEEHNLDECLQTLSFADELIVVLDKCTDKSKEITLKYTQNIIEGSWDMEGERRNVALDNCHGKWVLELDADERISETLKQEIINNITNNIGCNFEAIIDNYVGNRFVKHGWLRSIAVKKRQFIHYNGNKKYYQDRSLHSIANLKGEVKMLQNHIIHFMDDNITDLINRFNRYTSLRAKDIIASNKVINKRRLPSLFFSFLNRFFKAFVLHKGYREGSLGLCISLLCSSYNLVSYAKAIELKNK